MWKVWVKEIHLWCSLYLTMLDFRSSTDHGPSFVRSWQLTPRPCNDAYELVFIWGEKLKIPPFLRVKFSFHHNSSFLAFTEIVTFFSKEFWKLNFWIYWCWKWRKWKGAGRTVFDVDDNLPISLLSSLTVTFSFCMISWQWFCTLRSFSLGRLKVIFPEYTITPRNSEVDVAFW